MEDILQTAGISEVLEISKIVPYENNAKLHTKEQVKALKKSIKDSGYYQEIVIDENNVILAGHGRLEAIKELGYKMVGVRKITGLSNVKKKEMRLNDNLINSMTDYDLELLSLEISEIKQLGGSIELAGLNEELLASLEESEQEEIDTTEPEINPNEAEKRVKKGQLWQLGNHFLLCGDSLKKESIQRLLKGNIIDLVFCDPPYNLPAEDITHTKYHTDFVMGSGEMSKEEFIEFLAKYMENCSENSKDGSIHYHCMDWRHIEEITLAGKKIYGEEGLKNLCIWSKDTAGMGSFYVNQHELVFVFKKGKEKHTVNFHGYKDKRSNIWNYPSTSSFAMKDDEGNYYLAREKEHLKAHPTPKPLEMVIDAVRDCSNLGEKVMDLFGGSGTTLIACEKTNRQAFLCEFEEKYCDYILHRWEKLTGNKAKLLEDGE